jgi:putative membrane protein
MNLKSAGAILIKGAAMGIADLVPGVSGGTVAFISGIYPRLLSAIKGIPFLFPTLLNKGGSAAWKKGDLTFLSILFAGLLLGVLSFSKILTHLLEHYNQLLWAFFFGLIIVSIMLVALTIPKWKIEHWSSFIIGTGIGFWITLFHPIEIPESHLATFLVGAIAICAMILPGISGSFILLLLGKYHSIMFAVKNFEFLTIALFAAGCISGLLGFSGLISKVYNKFPYTITALLAGFMLGTLNKVWPWKITLKVIEKKEGVFIPIVQQNVLPSKLENPQLWPCIAFALCGALIMFLIHFFFLKNPKTNPSSL